MLSKLSQRIKKSNSSKRYTSFVIQTLAPLANQLDSRPGPLPTPLPSPNLSSSQVEASLSPTSGWRSRSPKIWSKAVLRRRPTQTSSYESTGDNPSFSQAYSAFLEQFPAYAQTRELDDLREREFRRLRESRSIYMDYMGACLYPDFLVKDHLRLLTEQVMGNTHSDSPS